MYKRGKGVRRQREKIKTAVERGRKLRNKYLDNRKSSVCEKKIPLQKAQG